jgi:hypothetical protein
MNNSIGVARKQNLATMRSSVNNTVKLGSEVDEQKLYALCRGVGRTTISIS